MSVTLKIFVALIFTVAIPALGQLTGGEIGWYAARQQDQISSLRASLTNLPVDPFRKVNKTYWDLRPIFQWDKEYTRMRLNILLGTPTRDVKPRPLPFWETHYNTVEQVLENGLVLSGYKERFIFLTNYPNFRTLKDGDKISFIAITNGTIKLFGTTEHTIESLDYGIPYNPIELQRSLQIEPKKTNSARLK